ncbi:MAG TPA: carboxymuconolactone decarboxylase family protein [archaeon]|nr:carboxymuconolactone decarboxylase family protein [archaeon]
MSEHKEILKNIEKKIGFKPGILHMLGELDPDFLTSYNRCDKKLLADGALSAKTKVLMALEVVVSQRSCTVLQMKSALNNGATKEEIMQRSSEIIRIKGV